MKILMTGATGFLGGHLTRELEAQGHAVVPVSRRSGLGVDWSEDALRRAIADVDVVCHLAGENVLGRWTAAKKKKIRESRVESTELLARLLAERGGGAMVNASAVGIYGDRGSERVDEDSSPGRGFLADVCVEWEAAAQPAREAGLRVATVRIGVILGADGGALKRMLLPFKLGIGGQLGGGDQFFPWVHVHDVARLFTFLCEHETASGAFNGVAPGSVTNREFTRTMGRVLGRPTVLPAPAFAVRAALGEAAGMLLEGQRVNPRRTLDAGFSFRQPELETALRDLLGARAAAAGGTR